MAFLCAVVITGGIIADLIVDVTLAERISKAAIGARDPIPIDPKLAIKTSPPVSLIEP